MLEYKEYADQLPEEERKWVENFYLEYYSQTGYYKDKDKRIIQNEEIQAEANRNHNKLKTDILDRNRIEPGAVSYLGDYDNFIQTETDDNWEEFFRTSGPELAFNEIIYETLIDLENKNINKELTLARFYSKMAKLGRLIRRDKRENK